MTKLNKYILSAVFFLFSQSVFAGTNPFAQTFSDIDEAQNIFLSHLKYEAQKQRIKKSLEIAKAKKAKRVKAYIQRRMAEFDAYEQTKAQKPETAPQKTDQTSINGHQNLKVTATAYTSHPDECNTNPFLGAWNNRLIPGSKSIAVSQDLLKKYRMKNGTEVRISGLPGVYRVVDTMHERYTKRIDIYMGMDKNRALHWGEKNVIIYWD